MQLLTFQVGPHLLAMPAQSVVSVGRGQEGERDGAAGNKVDLDGFLGLTAERRPGRPMIRFSHSGRTIDLQVDRILALENCEDRAVQPWPRLLKPLAYYSGVAVIGGKLFPIIDVGKVKDWRRGRRR